MGKQITSEEVTILMAVYNTKELFLRASIDSILKQTYRDFEFVIIDDGSNESTKRILQEYKDKRIKLVINESNIGLTKSLNKGLDISKGKYIARMDADDISYANRIKEQYSYMEKNTDVVALGCSMRICGSDHVLAPLKCLDDNDRRVKLLFDNVGIFHPTAFIRKSFLEKNGIRYNDDIEKAQDYDLWVKIVEQGGKLRSLKEILFEYRIHDDQITAKKYKEQEYFSKNIRIKQWKRLTKELTSEDIEILADILNSNNSKGKLNEAIKHLLKCNFESKAILYKYLKREIVRLWIIRIVRDMRQRHDFSGLFYKNTWLVFNPYYLWYIIYNRY